MQLLRDYSGLAILTSKMSISECITLPTSLRFEPGDDETQDITIQSFDEECTKLPKIRPAGSIFFRDKAKYKQATSGEAVPSFFMASSFPEKIPYHINGDVVHFDLIREHLASRGNASGTAYDIGANQGFYTYFLATLGLEVHSFEIMQDNFEALQHGMLYNPKEVANRVHVYPMGQSSKVTHMSTRGGQYTGFLDKADESTGKILSISMDCLAYHTGLPAYIPFIKIDVEGFEIDVLRGARQSFLQVKIGALLIEVGPSRWNRAGISLEEGIEEMNSLSQKFAGTYLLVRADNDPSCSMKRIQNSNVHFENESSPPVRRGVKLMKIGVPGKTLGSLLTEMEKTKADCNFWFTNP